MLSKAEDGWASRGFQGQPRLTNCGSICGKSLYLYILACADHLLVNLQ
jgi:hypothetical protein